MSSILLASDMANEEIQYLRKQDNKYKSTFKLKVKLLNDNGRLPQRSTDGAAGYDIYAAENYRIEPGNKGIISTGISIELPKCPLEGHIYCMKLMSRSGLSANHSIEVGAGLIDADYRGEIKVILYNHKPRRESYDSASDIYSFNYSDIMYINAGDRIAQGVIIPVAIPEVEEISKLTESARGIAGFGSTGV